MNTKQNDIATDENQDKIKLKIDTQQNVFINDESYLLNLESRIQKLKSLCQDVDPYGQMSDKIIADLNEVGITETYDPFSITNQLLLMLEDSIQEQINLRLKN